MNQVTLDYESNEDADEDSEIEEVKETVMNEDTYTKFLKEVCKQKVEDNSGSKEVSKHSQEHQEESDESSEQSFDKYSDDQQTEEAKSYMEQNYLVNQDEDDSIPQYSASPYKIKSESPQTKSPQRYHYSDDEIDSDEEGGYKSPHDEIA